MEIELLILLLMTASHGKPIPFLKERADEVVSRSNSAAIAERPKRAVSVEGDETGINDYLAGSVDGDLSVTHSAELALALSEALAEEPSDEETIFESVVLDDEDEDLDEDQDTDNDDGNFSDEETQYEEELEPEGSKHSSVDPGSRDNGENADKQGTSENKDQTNERGNKVYGNIVSWIRGTANDDISEGSKNEVNTKYESKSIEEDGLTSVNKDETTKDEDKVNKHKVGNTEDENETSANEGENTEEDEFIQNDGQNTEDDKFIQNDGQNTEDDEFIQNEGQNTEDDEIVQNNGQKTKDDKFIQNDGQKTKDDKFIQNDGQNTEDGEIVQNDGQKTKDDKFIQNDGQKTKDDKFIQNDCQNTEDGEIVQNDGQMIEDGEIIQNDSEREISENGGHNNKNTNKANDSAGKTNMNKGANNVHGGKIKKNLNENSHSAKKGGFEAKKVNGRNTANTNKANRENKIIGSGNENSKQKSKINGHIKKTINNESKNIVGAKKPRVNNGKNATANKTNQIANEKSDRTKQANMANMKKSKNKKGENKTKNKSKNANIKTENKASKEKSGNKKGKHEGSTNNEVSKTKSTKYVKANTLNKNQTSGNKRDKQNGAPKALGNEKTKQEIQNALAKEYLGLAKLKKQIQKKLEYIKNVVIGDAESDNTNISGATKNVASVRNKNGYTNKKVVLDKPVIVIETDKPPEVPNKPPKSSESRRLVHKLVHSILGPEHKGQKLRGLTEARVILQKLIRRITATKENSTTAKTKKSHREQTKHHHKMTVLAKQITVNEETKPEKQRKKRQLPVLETLLSTKSQSQDFMNNKVKQDDYKEIKIHFIPKEEGGDFSNAQGQYSSILSTGKTQANNAFNNDDDGRTRRKRAETSVIDEYGDDSNEDYFVAIGTEPGDKVVEVDPETVEYEGSVNDDMVLEYIEEDANSGYENWSSWGPCTVTCGFGHRQRKRKCLDFEHCRSGNVEITSCKMDGCVEDF
ncbi:uncharacterized protein DDB_G0290685-like [Gigantopelta aegis]|uniref:uncharacterized protein DDB_G0290685-like n=1 Tax=Gigantopelta aegis TaxID=1735272 RepID=UPI001B88C9D1|nr:uncharacterized protein DDB_G0290685-like [Gigantopelta aegis]XP_041364702.1 uncharacterized protein DDB_G0290685-like [Gigantopelta aegis]